MPVNMHWVLPIEAVQQYEKVLVPAMYGPAARALVAKAPLRPGDTVIDVGCGTGAAARLAAGKVSAMGRLIAIDINPVMLRVARSLPPARGAIVEYHEATAYHLPVERESAAALLYAHTFQYLTDRPTALHEAYRVVRSGGTISMTVWGDPAENPYLDALTSSVTRHFGAEVADELTLGLSIHDGEAIRPYLVRAGFRSNTILKEQLELDLAGPEEFVPLHLSATSIAPAFEAAPLEQREAVIRDVSNAMAPYRTAAGMRVPFSMHIIIARK